MQQSTSTEKNSSGGGWLAFCALGALAMSYGWGFRGDYGHAAGAAVPGALLGMGLCLRSRRADWHRRCGVAGLLGALGWAVGGEMSYGMIPAYTISRSFPDVYYGYACLFIVGALWGGIGAAILSFGFTKSRSELQRFVAPVATILLIHLALWPVLRAVPGLGDWLSSIEPLDDNGWRLLLLAVLISGGFWIATPRTRPACGLLLALPLAWYVGYFVLSVLPGLHMQPKPGGEFRSDAWAGCAGMLLALLFYLFRTRNRAGIVLTLYGILGGGLGFSVGNFINIPDKVRWELFWRHEWLRGFDHWKWTEQSFGLIMGLIVGLGAWRLVRSGLAAPNEDEDETAMIGVNDLAVLFLLIALPLMNLHKNVEKWIEWKRIPEENLFGLSSSFWCFTFMGLLILLVLYGWYQHRQNRFPVIPAAPMGRGQLLFLLLMWVTAIGVVIRRFPLESKGLLFVHGSFLLTCVVCTFLVFQAREASDTPGSREVPPDDESWGAGWAYWVVLAAVPVILAALVALTLFMHAELLEAPQFRFGPDAYHLQAPE